MTEASAANPAVDREERRDSATLRRGFASREAAVTTLLAAIAWLAVIVIALDMGNGSGTMGLALWAFVGVWALMMTAMMLPSIAPVASLYVRAMPGTGGRRWWRLALFVGGYLLVWIMSALPAYALLRLADELVAGKSWSRWVAAAIFAVGGLYQLTPLKQRCLLQCRSPLGLLLHYGSYRGRTRDLRAAVHHGAYCLGCCWALMLLFVAFGAMNLVAMVALATVVLTEKVSPQGERLSRVFGIGCLALAAAVLIWPGIAPGLTSMPEMMG